jgi:hypothetical protein
MSQPFHQSQPDPSSPIALQIGEALRFLNRLVALAPSERAAIRIPEDPVAYAETARQVVAGVEQGYQVNAGAAEFAEQVDRQLDALGITGNLFDLARLAVRAILVRPLPRLRASALMVYAPFENAIPYASLRAGG